METVVFPSTLRKIPQNAFYGCNNLRDVIFAEGLVKIGRSAFRESGL